MTQMCVVFVPTHLSPSIAWTTMSEVRDRSYVLQGPCELIPLLCSTQQFPDLQILLHSTRSLSYGRVQPLLLSQRPCTLLPSLPLPSLLELLGPEAFTHATERALPDTSRHRTHRHGGRSDTPVQYPICMYALVRIAVRLYISPSYADCHVNTEEDLGRCGLQRCMLYGLENGLPDVSADVVGCRGRSSATPVREKRRISGEYGAPDRVKCVRCWLAPSVA